MKMRMVGGLLLAIAAGIAAAQAASGETVKIYAAAVMKTPLTALAADYEKKTGTKIAVVYDTAGATEQKFRADPDADLLITTVALIRNAEKSGALKDGTSTPLGSTFAGVAVTPRSAKPDVSSPEKLKAALLAAKSIAVSDPSRGATVGTHFMKVIETLGVKDQVMPKITLARDGVETMHMVVEGRVEMGVSQSSEIVQASPDAMAGPFPAQFALTTDFTLWHRRDISPAVRDFVGVLMSREGREKMAADGLALPAAR
jgi:molybdate transport system substrate-binding protein